MTRPTDSNRLTADNSPGGFPGRSLFDCGVQFRSDENDHDLNRADPPAERGRWRSEEPARNI